MHCMQYAEKKQTEQQSLYYTKYSILKLFGLTVDFFILLNEGVQVFFHDIWHSFVCITYFYIVICLHYSYFYILLKS